jgi:hypothetical protein
VEQVVLAAAAAAVAAADIQQVGVRQAILVLLPLAAQVALFHRVLLAVLLFTVHYLQAAAVLVQVLTTTAVLVLSAVAVVEQVVLA